MTLVPWLAPHRIVTTAPIGRAMLNLARGGQVRAILEPPDILIVAGRFT